MSYASCKCVFSCEYIMKMFKDIVCLFVKVKNLGYEIEEWTSVQVETLCSDRMIDGL